ncbi:MAG: RDD family protein [Puniceicoccaceae bacterium]
MLEENVANNEFDIESTKPAGFWIRVAAYLIDILVLLILIVASNFVPSFTLYLILMVPMICYKPVLEGLLGGTAGKLALGLKVINSDGEKLGLVGGFMRSALFILPNIPGILIKMKEMEANLKQATPEEAMQFLQDNAILYGAMSILTLAVIISCIVVAFTNRKRGWHDLIGDSYVIYTNK